MNLQYLNLSKAVFSGLIPPHFGNLSHLQSLDLKSFSLHVENIHWLAGLVSLKDLAVDGVYHITLAHNLLEGPIPVSI